MALDATAASLAEAIAAAREALLQKFREQPDEWQRAYELKSIVQNGWSDGAMNLALGELLDEGLLEVKGDLVRLKR